jgi:hypothetical protein
MVNTSISDRGFKFSFPPLTYLDRKLLITAEINRLYLTYSKMPPQKEQDVLGSPSCVMLAHMT